MEGSRGDLHSGPAKAFLGDKEAPWQLVKHGLNLNHSKNDNEGKSLAILMFRNHDDQERRKPTLTVI